MSGPLRLPFLAPEPWRVAVLGPTGRYARNQVAGMIAAGTPVVAGIALGRGGEALDGLKLYDRLADVPERPNIAVIYTPAAGVRAAIAEAVLARIPTIVAVAEYVPVHDTLAAAAQARAAATWLVGPNTLGIFVHRREKGVMVETFLPLIEAGTVPLGQSGRYGAQDNGRTPVAIEVAHRDSTRLPVYVRWRGAGEPQALPGPAVQYPEPGAYHLAVLIDSTQRAFLQFQPIPSGEMQTYPLGHIRFDLPVEGS